MNLLKRYPITSFIVLSFLITYVIGIPMFVVLQELQSFIGTDISILNEFFMKFGPTLAGIALTAIVYGRNGVKDLFSRCIRFSGAWGLCALAILGPPIISVVTFLIMGYGDYASSLSIGTFLTSFSGQLALAALLGGGLGEELGWRGFMLPEILNRHKPWGATLVVGVAWFSWHIPAFIFFSKGSDDPILPFFFICLLVATIFTWSYFRTNKSLAIPILMHGSANASFYTMDELFPDVVAKSGFQPGFDWALMSGYLVLTLIILGFSNFRVTRKEDTMTS